MPGVLVDSNVLLDILTADPIWLEWSSRQVESLALTSSLVINPIIYAEISYRFSRIEEVDETLLMTMFAREPISYEAAFLAAKAHVLYRRRKGTRLSPLPDFFIGAHAAVKGYDLLTRDATRYRTYFPSLRFIAPE